jgi:hypothetical protein
MCSGCMKFRPGTEGPHDNYIVQEGKDPSPCSNPVLQRAQDTESGLSVGQSRDFTMIVIRGEVGYVDTD